MNEKEYKTEIIDKSLNKFKDIIEYRWSDVLDYICEKWDLDNEWEDILETASQNLYNKSFYDSYITELNETKYKLESTNISEKISIFISEYLKNRFETSIKQVI